jgi:hypothetical protein
LRNQTIHIFSIGLDGKFSKVQDVGWFCNNEAKNIYQEFLLKNEPENFASLTAPSQMLSGIQQRVLSYFYTHLELFHEDPKIQLARFYGEIEHFTTLVLSRILVLDDSHFLLLLSKYPDPVSKISGSYFLYYFFRIIHISITRVSLDQKNLFLLCTIGKPQGFYRYSLNPPTRTWIICNEYYKAVGFLRILLLEIVTELFKIGMILACSITHF